MMFHLMKMRAFASGRILLKPPAVQSLRIVGRRRAGEKEGKKFAASKENSFELNTTKIKKEPAMNSKTMATNQLSYTKSLRPENRLKFPFVRVLVSLR